MEKKSKKELMKYIGSMQQLAYIRPLTYTEGRASGLKAYEVKNGLLSYKMQADKCLDVLDFSYKGVDLNFLAKPGLGGRNHFDTNGDEALRSIMGGLFFTCGLENICAPCEVEGAAYPMHGRMRTTPAEHLSANAFWQDDTYVIRASGEMREAELFGENMVLRRSIQTHYGEKSILVHDEIENESYRSEPLMLLYHCNIGYPLLDEGSRILLPTKKVTPRDEASATHQDSWRVMDEPKDNEEEYVFIHELATDTASNTMACVINEELELGICIEWNTRNLPYFMEWKSTASGDYAVGFEPSNASVYGRTYHEEHGNLHRLEPFAKEVNEVRFTVLDGKEELQGAENKIQQLLNNKE